MMYMMYTIYTCVFIIHILEIPYTESKNGGDQIFLEKTARERKKGPPFIVPPSQMMSHSSPLSSQARLVPAVAVSIQHTAIQHHALTDRLTGDRQVHYTMVAARFTSPQAAEPQKTVQRHTDSESLQR
jgi:hypothetical protein